MPRLPQYLAGLFAVALFVNGEMLNGPRATVAAAEREEISESQPIDRQKQLGQSGEPSGASPIARLQDLLAAGGTIQWDDRWGYLRDLLVQLDIDPDSQSLVFSKTSFQPRRIDPKHPRAIYFNDSTYVGWVQGILVAVSATIAILIFTAGTMGWFLTKNRIYESVALILIAFALFRPDFFMNRIAPPFAQIEPAQLTQAVGEAAPGSTMRIEVAGPDFDTAKMT